MKTRICFRALAIAALSSASPFAIASSCDSVLWSYANGWTNAPQYHPECFGASSQAAAASVNQTSFVQINAISSALANRFLVSPPPKVAGLSSGAAAAAPGKKLNVWGNLTDNATRQDYFRPLAGNNIKIDTDALTTTVGGDYALSATMVAGVSAAFDRAKGDSYTNGALQNSAINKGWLVAPYVGLSLSKSLALDASLGFGQGELSQTGNVRAEADRWFAGVNLNYSQWMGNTQLSGRLGWLHGEEDYANATAGGATLAGTSAKNKIDQWRIGGQASWWMNGAMPYVGIAYLTESRSTTLAGATDPIGKDAWQWSLGVNFLSVAKGVTGGIAWLEETGRDNQKNRQLVANLGLRF